MIEKLKVSVKREFIYYLVTLIVLAFIMHSDLLSSPLARFEAMQSKGNYTHPFLYAFVVYMILFIMRKIIDFFTNIFQKKSQ